MFTAYADAYHEGSGRCNYRTVIWRNPDFEYTPEAVRTDIYDAPPPPQLAKLMEGFETLKIYEEIRWAAMASSWPVPQLYLSFKSGYAKPGFGHFNPDLNSIRVVSEGEGLIYSSHGYGTPAIGFSNLLVDGKAQGQSTGTFLDWRENKNLRMVLGEADSAFGESVRRFRRHAVMVDGKYIVVLDEIAAKDAVSVSFQVHTPGDIEKKDNRAILKGIKSSLHLLFVREEKLEMEINNEPSNTGRGIGENQRTPKFVLRATASPTKELILPTIIWPTKVGSSELPEASWEDGRLQINRPDGKTDELIFEQHEDGGLRLKMFLKG